jgi:tRNA-splicing ligase RtcB
MSAQIDWQKALKRIDGYKWLIPKSTLPWMRTDGLIFASEQMMEHVLADKAPEQVANVAALPGIVGPSMAMPDIHWGYGFAIGGVAATDAEEGVISPGGVGFDINCGVRLLRTDLTEDKVKPRIKELIDQIFRDVPAGFGGSGPIELDYGDLKKVLTTGAQWMIEHGFGWEEDLDRSEQQGAVDGAEVDAVSSRAMQRGLPQIGTLGSGNHFLEIQLVDQIYDEQIARAFEIDKVGQVCVMMHTGSRGFGHQACTDSLDEMQVAIKRYGIDLPDRQLACAPIKSPEGQRYLAAMACAANFALANRQAITHWVRQAFKKVFGGSPNKLGIRQVYDVAHNIAKPEVHEVDGRSRNVWVHRKGATRAFGPGNPEVAAKYRHVGQPVLIPGDMGRYSYLLVGTEKAMRETFGSTCHGAGRMMSRKKAKSAMASSDVRRMMEEQGILVRAKDKSLIAEEASYAYKDVADVVEVCEAVGISRRVARLKPIGVVKG